MIIKKIKPKSVKTGYPWEPSRILSGRINNNNNNNIIIIIIIKKIIIITHK